MNRLFIEISDIDYSRLKTLAILFEQKMYDWKFNKVIENAAINPQVTWEAVKEADEIYMDTALVRSGYGIASSDLFNNLMHKAIQEDIKGKKLFIFRPYEGIKWYNLRSQLVARAFQDNELYVEDIIREKRDGWKDLIEVYVWKKVNLDKLLQDTM